MGQSGATQFSDRSHRLGTFMSFCRITLLLEKISVLVDEDNPINPLKGDRDVFKSVLITICR